MDYDDIEGSMYRLLNDFHIIAGELVRFVDKLLVPVRPVYLILKDRDTKRMSHVVFCIVIDEFLHVRTVEIRKTEKKKKKSSHWRDKTDAHFKLKIYQTSESFYCMLE